MDGGEGGSLVFHSRPALQAPATTGEPPYIHVRMVDGVPRMSGLAHYAIGQKIPRRDGSVDGVFAEWRWDGRTLSVANCRYGLRPIFYFVRPGEICVSTSIEKLLALGRFAGARSGGVGRLLPAELVPRRGHAVQVHPARAAGGAIHVGRQPSARLEAAHRAPERPGARRGDRRPGRDLSGKRSSGAMWTAPSCRSAAAATRGILCTSCAGSAGRACA